MNTDSDVIVIGAGPCGSFAAFKLARRHTSVAVYEEHDQIGVPSHCAGHLSIRGLKRLGLHPLPSKIVENTFSNAIFYSPKGNKFSVHLSSPITCVVNRALFDKHVAETAENAGADYSRNSRVESLIIEKGFVKGVVIMQEGKIIKKRARVVVDAEGITAKIVRQAGLPRLNTRMLVNGIEAEAENVEGTETGRVEIFLGRDYAPGFYAWLIPKREDKAKVGLAAKNGNPKMLLRRLMLKHPAASKKLRKARITQASFHPITLGGPIPQTYSNGFLALGDAASQVKPTTGGGVIFGMTCAEIAAEIASDAVQKNDASSEFLSSYHRRFNEVMGFDVNFMLRMRRTLDSMSDAQLDNLISLCSKLDLQKTFRNVDDIDFQGKTALRALRNPRMLTALSYFIFVYFKNL